MRVDFPFKSRERESKSERMGFREKEKRKERVDNGRRR